MSMCKFVHNFVCIYLVFMRTMPVLAYKVLINAISRNHLSASKWGMKSYRISMVSIYENKILEKAKKKSKSVPLWLISLSYLA